MAILKEATEELFVSMPAKDEEDTGRNRWINGLKEKLDYIRDNRVLFQSMFLDLNTDEWMSLIRDPYDRQTESFWKDMAEKEGMEPESQELCKLMDCMQLAMYLNFFAHHTMDNEESIKDLERMLVLQKKRRSKWEKILFQDEITLVN